MTSTGPQRSLCLLFALLLAGVIAIVPGCKDPEPASNGGSTTGTTDTSGTTGTPEADGGSASNGGGSVQDPSEVDSEPLRAVLEFQQAILDLDLEKAKTMVDETTPAYQSLVTAVQTLEGAQNPALEESVRESIINLVRSAWVGATAEEAANEGGSAIIAVTRSNGSTVDINLNFFDGKWLIIGPDDLTQLR